MPESNAKPVLLIVDDEPANLQKLQRTFVGQYQVYEASSGEEAMDLAVKLPVDAVITDQRMPRMSGVELLRRLMKVKPDVMRIVLTGYTEVEDLIDAINEGHVYRYITKPWDPDEMRIVVRQAMEWQSMERENRRLTEELKKANDRLNAENRVLKHDVQRFMDIDTLVHLSGAMEEILQSSAKVAQADSTVLITGETGTGKEMVARYIHRHSNRLSGLFVAVNCGAVPRDLAESEFFGHRKGAFTGATSDKKGYFQLADGGTLFLDEIGEAPPDLQVKLLRVIQTGEVWAVGADRPKKTDARIIASTNRELHREVASGRFREDLFFRLNVFSIRIPPLRERREDIRPLVALFVERFKRKLNRKPGPLKDDAVQLLESFAWPGNIRQLENEVERMILLSDDGMPLGRECLSRELADTPAVKREEGPISPITVQGDMDMRRNMDSCETRMIVEAIKRTGGNRTRAAELLGITRQSLLDRMKRMSIRG